MPDERIFDITHAIRSLYPEAEWSITNEDYESLIWLSDTPAPSEEELIEEVQRLQFEYDSLQYQRLRAKEYPDFREYLDGIVKGDQSQIEAYITACLEVKQKYPKPE